MLFNQKYAALIRKIGSYKVQSMRRRRRPSAKFVAIKDRDALRSSRHTTFIYRVIAPGQLVATTRGRRAFELLLFRTRGYIIVSSCPSLSLFFGIQSVTLIDLSILYLLTFILQA